MPSKSPLTTTQLKRLTSKLGKQTDASLVGFGVSREYVQKLRVSLDIPAHNSGPAMSTAWPIRFTVKAVAAIRRAMKVAGYTNRSKYVRDAVKEKNDNVLKGGGK